MDEAKGLRRVGDYSVETGENQGFRQALIAPWGSRLGRPARNLLHEILGDR